MADRPERIAKEDRGSDRLVLGVSIGIYLALIFTRLGDFPPYFFCDEAVGGVDARSILTTGADIHGSRLPVFFEGLGDYALSLSVYLEIPFVYFLGLNELAVRLTTACASLIGVGAAYALARHVFGVRPAWATFAIFAASPVWYLHSRTGFEYVLATSLFLAFALFYLLTLRGRSGFVVPAAAAAAGCFYSYTPARGWIAVSLVLLALVNFAENLRRWRVLLAGALLLALFLAPALYVHWTRPEVAMKRLAALNFAEFRDQPLGVELSRVFDNYRAGLDPRFWYTWGGTQNSGPMQRHVIPGLPQLPLWTAPFALLGLVTSFGRLRTPEHRSLFALLGAALLPASLVGFNNARAMPVAPLLLLFSLIGLGVVWARFARSGSRERIARAIVLAGLVIVAARLHEYVFDIARRSYADYGFYGAQSGAPEVFEWIARNHERYREVRVADGAFNAAWIFPRFYLQGDALAKTSLYDPKRLCSPGTPPPAGVLYVAPAETFAELKQKGCPLDDRVAAAIADPRGRPLFVMAEVDRGPGFADWLRGEDERRLRLERSTVVRDGVTLDVEHPRFDIGDAAAVFDGSTHTLARSAEVNPARFVVHLPEKLVRHVVVTLSHTGAATVMVLAGRDGERRNWGTQRFAGSGGELRAFDFAAAEPASPVTTLEIVVHVTNEDERGFVHVNEISWD